MANDEIDKMEAGPELDLRIADELFGAYSKPGRGGVRVYFNDDGQAIAAWCEEEGYSFTGNLPAYSTDIAAAWEVVEKMEERGLTPSIGKPAMNKSRRHLWQVSFEDWDEILAVENSGDSYTGMPAEHPSICVAICLAALAAVRSQKGAPRV